MDVANYIFGSEIGTGFGEPGGTPPRKNSQENYLYMLHVHLYSCNIPLFLLGRCPNEFLMNDETEDLHEYRQLLQDPHVGIVETTWK